MIIILSPEHPAQRICDAYILLSCCIFAKYYNYSTRTQRPQTCNTANIPMHFVIVFIVAVASRLHLRSTISIVHMHANRCGAANAFVFMQLLYIICKSSKILMLVNSNIERKTIFPCLSKWNVLGGLYGTFVTYQSAKIACTMAAAASPGLELNFVLNLFFFKVNYVSCATVLKLRTPSSG